MARKKSILPRDLNALENMNGGPAEVVEQGRSLVFISHDSRDADLAEIFANLLSDVSAGTLKNFRSSDKKGNAGIEFGAEWYAAIMSKLSGATDVVALLTQQSVDRPWILYESGVAKGKLDTNVVGLALGVPLERVSTGPFGQFQNVADDEDSLTKLVMQLLRRNPDAAPREEAVRMQVKVFRDSAGKILAQRGKKPVDSPTDETNAAKLFEEVKAMVRELPERVDQRVREFNPKLRRKSRRFHPAMIDEIVHIAGFREGGATGAAALLAFLSFVREDTTPLYEAGLEFYRSIVSGKEIEIKKNGELVIEVIKLIEHPLFRDISTSEDREYLHYISRALRHLVARILEMHLSRRGKKPLGLDADEDEPKSN